MRRFPALAAALAVMPAQAFAHSSVPGIEGFYTGFIHPLTTPAQIVALLATSLLIGQFRPSRYGVLGGGYVAALLAGLLFGDPLADLDPWLFGTATLAAGLAALLPGRVLPLAAALAVAAGFLLGAGSVPDAGGPLKDRIFTMAGSMLGGTALMLYAAGLATVALDKIRRNWFSIGLRILSAWVAAISALMLALALAVPGASV
ncbi:HupE/UreJ family protein [Tropicimonas sp. IMCC34043]|uniref:HupE/UreJ family protein n=1 Tax=Tropicimonas sp. IMCC34043 TaxID=2248760 RepID=UPI000E267C42|nr:HupE/UreJ family protein [Tropicimonas sp. IMCC34043]